MRKRGRTAEQEATDAALAGKAGAGDLDAFEELYRRHVEAAWRVALAITADPDDAADAVSDAFTRVFQALPDRLHAADHFLPYLLAAVRNAGIDVLRRGARQHSVDLGDDRDWAAAGGEPADAVLDDVDAALVARAFRSLPERWRSVLWLTEVERIPARDVAPLLGVSPNGVAQLAVRARAGLRERYLQAHLGHTEVRLLCRDTVERLGAYAVGGLAPRDISKVDQHLAGCDACRSRLAQLEDLAPTLRRSVLPLPAVLAAMALGRWRLASSASTGSVATSAASAGPAPVGVGAVGAAGPAAGGLGVGGAAAVALPGPLAASVASAALFVAGVVGVGAVSQRAPEPPPPAVASPAPTFGAATVRTGTAKPAEDGVAVLMDETARAAAELAALPGALTGALPGELAPLVPGADLEALTQGQVKVDTGTTVVDIDLRAGPAACRQFKVLGVAIACPSVDVPSPPPVGADVPLPAPPAVADEAARVADTAVTAAGAAVGAAGAGVPPQP